MLQQNAIQIEVLILAPVEVVWQYFTDPEHIVHWNNASPDWHTPKAENDLQVGGKFSYTMAAKDGSFSFDFWGIYEIIKENQLLKYTLGDGRKVSVEFISVGDDTRIVEIFEPEEQNALEMQKNGWQAILDNFKKYVEEN
ncbi:MAG: SRPBCC family protein [Bacteroidota bacterium]